MAPYVAAKHGLLGLSLSLLREFIDRKVRVTVVNPGRIDTGFGGGEEGRGDGHGSLRPAELAAQVVAVLDAPPNLVVDEITLHPIGQRDF
jgi:NADP-dependent 3-hydroxy acid dehydrogenase YdfG